MAGTPKYNSDVHHAMGAIQPSVTVVKEAAPPSRKLGVTT
jgi:hypothetical protein